jgi:iron complex transport system substrate-binding protein
MRCLPLILLAGILFAGPDLARAQTAATRVFVDSAGRHVIVPKNIERVYAAGPPASIILYTLAPEKLIGWNRRLHPAEKAFMPARYATLPVLGRLTGRGNTANIEIVLKANPDIILDYGSISETYKSLADRVQEQTGIPYLLIDGSFNNTARTYRLLGDLLDKKRRAERLAGYTERVLANVTDLLEKIPLNRRPRVYYGRRRDGLETGLGGSINVEILERVGAVNVAANAASGKGLASVSMEQILKWNPEVILTLEKHFFESLASDPLWQNVQALQNDRVYLAPRLPFGWFDRPPSVNRLIGVKWLASVLYGEDANHDLPRATREFYRLFYHIDLSDDQLSQLIEHAVVSDDKTR